MNEDEIENRHIIEVVIGIIIVFLICYGIYSFKNSDYVEDYRIQKELEKQVHISIDCGNKCLKKNAGRICNELNYTGGGIYSPPDKYFGGFILCKDENFTSKVYKNSEMNYYFNYKFIEDCNYECFEENCKDE